MHRTTFIDTLFGTGTTNFPDLVKRYRRRRAAEVIYNASTAYGKVIIRNLLEDAAERRLPVRLVSHELYPKFYDDLAGDFADCLDGGASVAAIVLNPEADLKGNRLAELLAQHENAVLTKAARPLRSKIPHYILVGDRSFPLETSHEHSMAIATFNNDDIGPALGDLFDDVKRRIERDLEPADPTPAT